MPTPPLRPAFLVGVLFCLAASLASCATSRRPPAATVLPSKRHMEHVVIPQATGFMLVVSVARPQCLPEIPAMAEACKRAGTALAYTHAEKRRKTIRPLGEQDVHLAVGRNSLTDITSCLATVTAEWER